MGKLQEILQKTMLVTAVRIPGKRGQREGTAWGAQIITHARRDMGKRTVLENQRHGGWW